MAGAEPWSERVMDLLKLKVGYFLLGASLGIIVTALAMCH